MIIEVSVGDEDPRRYRIERRGFQFLVHPLEGDEPAPVAGVGPASVAGGGPGSASDGIPGVAGDGPGSAGDGIRGVADRPGSAADGPRDATQVEAGGAGESVDPDAAAEAAGEPLVIDWRRPEDGLYSLLVDHHSYEVFVDDNGHALTVHLLDRTFQVQAADARRRRAIAAAQAADGAVRITAPIPGRVTRVLATVGSDVKQGEGVVLVEAMKMENELRAPRDGTVTSIEVEEGQGVEGGALLAIIE